LLLLLGKPAVSTGDRLQPLGLRPKALALLTRLALTEGPQLRESLAELLFHQATDPRDSLRWHLSYLRARLPDVLIVDRRAIEVRVPTDVAAFRDGAARILRDPSTADGQETLALYRGDLCSGLRVAASAEFHNWLYVEEDAVRRTFRQAAVTFAHRAIAGGRPTAAIPSLRRLTEVDPYLEVGHVLLVRANESAADTDAARRAYDRYQRILRSELHAEPRPELAETYEPRSRPGRVMPSDELVPLSKITMHVLDWPGEEPAIVAIHGSAGHAYGLTALGEQLSPDVRAIAIDLRGHGFSDKPPAGYGVEDHVEDILQLVATLDLHQPVLLGHSIGGAIATFVAAAAGDRIGGLILLDAVVGDLAFIESASIVVDEWGPSLDARFSSFDEYHARWGQDRGGGEWQRWLERSDRMELAPLPDGTLRRRGLRQALEAEWASVAQADALGALAHIRRPVLVVHATGPWADGPYIDEATIRAQLTTAADSRLYLAHGLNHGDVVRRPDPALVGTLKRFARETRT
jgi:pimeloyl-ACP methyl ester carboxylesterase/DNA-binding SARP family transcriptional activator